MQSNLFQLNPVIRTGRSTRGVRNRTARFVVLALVCVLAVLPAAGVQAQGIDDARGSFGLPTMPPMETEAAASFSSAHSKKPAVIVDTDTGVDDAVALAWLFNQVLDNKAKIRGIVTVGGNTSVENATENVLYLLSSTAGWIDPGKWPAVVQGASKPPFEQLSSTPKLWHGTDGLGYARYFMRDEMDWTVDELLPLVQYDARSFYCSSKPSTIITLGPLTNIAKAIKTCPEAMQQHRYVILGGAKGSGNQTVVAEYNFYQDPWAAKIVMQSGLDVTLVIREEFDSFTLQISQVDKLLRSNEYAPLALTSNLVGSALCWYVGVQSLDYATMTPTNTPVSIPDPAALMFALDPSYSAYWDVDPSYVVAQAKVEVIGFPELLQGQSLIGYYYPYPEALTMEVPDSDISAVIDAGLADVVDSDTAQLAVAGIYYQMATMQADIVPNAFVAQMLDGPRMSADFMAAFGAADGEATLSCFDESVTGQAGAFSSQRYSNLAIPDIGNNDSLDQSLYLPMLSR